METSYIKFIQKSKINLKSYFLYGNEEVLRQDCSELISKNFCSEGYSKLVTFGLDGFDNLEEEILKLSGGSLFQEKLIIKIKHLEAGSLKFLKNLSRKINLIRMIKMYLSLNQPKPSLIRLQNGLKLSTQT